MTEHEILAAVLALLSADAADAVVKNCSLGGRIHEIRLRRGGNVVLVRNGQAICTSVYCRENDFDETLRRICGNSLYAHGDTIRDGYIRSAEGFRVGVCGRAILENDRIVRVTDFTSLCIRLPSRVPGAADALLPYILAGNILHSMLIWSPPGIGKTTLLRELASVLSTPERGLRCALVDSRQELEWGLDCSNLDVLSGYPRAAGMEIAVRTMSPQIVICDEIFTDADAEAVLCCAASGAAVIASAHAGSSGDLWHRPPLRRLIEAGVFSTLVGLSRGDEGLIFDITEGITE